jgi:hypothetical protein
MGNMTGQIKSELKQLPFMIGKTLGGIMAVTGFTTAVVILTRRADPSIPEILPSALSGLLGIIVFMFSSTLQARRLAKNPTENSASGNPTRTSMLSWAILLLLGTIFLSFSYLIAR